MKEERMRHSEINQFPVVLLLLFMGLFCRISNGSKQTGLSTLQADKERAIQVSHRRDNYTAPLHRRGEKREKAAKLQVKQRGKNEEKGKVVNGLERKQSWFEKKSRE